MIKLKQAVIVEGKYDKITLENIIDATIITTDGYGIFKNKEKRDLIKLLAKRNGIVVITDSDAAGAVIRSHIKQICNGDNITNVYVPQLAGKERRKAKPSKQGFLGVEGLDRRIIEDALKRSGITGEYVSKRTPEISKTQLYELGLSGGANSAKLRKSLASFLNLPTDMSCNAFLDCINAVCGYNEFIKAVELWRQEADKR